MKLNHQNIELIESWLASKNMDVSFDHEFIRTVYHEVLLPLFKISQVESIKTRKRAITLQYDFVRRDLLKIKYKQNNKSANGIRAGYVYAIANPAWPNFIKIGSAIDVNDRLKSYQTSSPLRDFYLIDYYFVDDRISEEENILSLFERNSEWCKITIEEVKALFRKKKREHNISVPSHILYEIKNKNQLQKMQ
jgi:hypothetical protein